MDKSHKNQIQVFITKLQNLQNGDAHLTDVGCCLHFIANELKVKGDQFLDEHKRFIDKNIKAKEGKDGTVASIGFSMLGIRFYEMISDAVKTTGTYDPQENLCFFEEKLTMDEIEEIEPFLRWVHEDTDNRAFGHGNYEERYLQFKQWRNAEIKIAISSIRK